MQRNVALAIIVGIAVVTIVLLSFIGDWFGYWFGSEPVVYIQSISITCDPSKGTARVRITSEDATPDLDRSRYSIPATMRTTGSVTQVDHQTDDPNPLARIHEIYEFENTGTAIGTATGTFTVYDLVNHLVVKTFVIQVPNACATESSRNGPLTAGEVAGGTITGL